MLLIICGNTIAPHQRCSIKARTTNDLINKTITFLHQIYLEISSKHILINNYNKKPLCFLHRVLCFFFAHHLCEKCCTAKPETEGRRAFLGPTLNYHLHPGVTEHSSSDLKVAQLSFTRHLAWITDHYTRTQLGRMIMMGHNHMCVRPAASSNHGISANSIVFDFVSSLLSRLDLGAGNWSTLDLNP